MAVIWSDQLEQNQLNLIEFEQAATLTDAFGPEFSRLPPLAIFYSLNSAHSSNKHIIK